MSSISQIEPAVEQLRPSSDGNRLNRSGGSKKASAYLFWVGIVLLAILAAYANSFHNAFEFDDFHTVVDNPAIRSLRSIPRFFTDATTFSVQPPNRTYRPIVSTSLAFDYALANGYKPFWFHLSTFTFFIGLLVLQYFLCRLALDKIRLSPVNRWLALICAAWFGLHPAIAETINYVIQRGDLYCTLGCVAALWIFARYPELRRTSLYLAPLAFALLSKPPAVVFPALLFFYVFFFEADNRSNRLKYSFRAALPSVIFTILLMVFESAMTPKSFLPSIIRPWDYRLTEPYVWLRYFGELFLPLHLNVDTDLAPFSHFTGEMAAGLAFLAALCLAIWITARHRLLYPIAYGLLWFLITQLPTSIYPLSEVENDHRMFFSFVGLMLAVAWGVWLAIDRLISARRASSKLRYALIASIVLVLCAYGWGTHMRNAVWHDEESLWHDDILKSPHNGRGLMIYGLTQMKKGRYEQARDLFEKAQLYTPNYSTLEINLGIVNGAIADRGNPPQGADAEHHFLRAIMLAPSDDLPHAYYGQWLGAHDRSGEAIAQLRTAIALNPERPLQHQLLNELETRTTSTLGHPLDISSKSNTAREASLTQDASTWINRSLDEYRHAKLLESIHSALQALQLDPKSAEAYNNLGAAYGALQEWDEAVHFEQEALRLRPNLVVARNNLVMFSRHHNPAISNWTPDELVDESLALYQAGYFKQSIAAARYALSIDPASAAAWNNIAASNAAMHQWDDAIVAAEKALAFKPDFQLAKNNLAWARNEKAKSER